MLAIDQQVTIGCWRVFVSGTSLDRGAPVEVPCAVGEETGGAELGDDPEVLTDTLVPERQMFHSKTGLELPREKFLAGRKAEMEECTNAFEGKRDDIRAKTPPGPRADLESSVWISDSPTNSGDPRPTSSTIPGTGRGDVRMPRRVCKFGNVGRLRGVLSQVAGSSRKPLIES